MTLEMVGATAAAARLAARGRSARLVFMRVAEDVPQACTQSVLHAVLHAGSQDRPAGVPTGVFAGVDAGVLANAVASIADVDAGVFAAAFAGVSSGNSFGRVPHPLAPSLGHEAGFAVGVEGDFTRDFNDLERKWLGD